MGTRKIVHVDDDLCDGCGNCIVACAEGALKLVGGKARIVKDLYCDGFGDCVGECPTGALTIEEREAEPFDSEATRAHVERIGGVEAVQRMDAAAAEHDRKERGASLPLVASPAPVAPGGGGCPGSRTRVSEAPSAPSEPIAAGGPPQAIPSELRQWPVQLHLVQPGAPFFRDRELVILSTCGPVASADVHWRFLRGRSVVIACPKLDDTRPYTGKLAAILGEPSIPKVSVVRMEVPCCGGLTSMASEAAAMSGRTDLVVEEVTLGVNGDFQAVEVR
jgi:NAD-dependent dihydropyrimidine dehydrogenase PreA subunit